MDRTLREFVDRGWFDFGPDCQESLVIFFALYNGWCLSEEKKRLSGNEMCSELEEVGVHRIGEYLEGIELNSTGQAITRAALELRLVLEEDSRQREEEDRPEEFDLVF